MAQRRRGTIRFLTRRDCALCREALALLRRPARLAAVDVRQVDVDDDEGLREQFGSRVPVLLAADGSVLAEGRIAPRDARRAVWRARSLSRA